MALIDAIRRMCARIDLGSPESFVQSSGNFDYVSLDSSTEFWFALVPYALGWQWVMVTILVYPIRVLYGVLIENNF